MNLAHEAAVYAAAFADSVQRSHPPVPAGMPVTVDQTTHVNSISSIRVDQSQKHIEALIEYVIERVTSHNDDLTLTIAQDTERDREVCI